MEKEHEKSEYRSGEESQRLICWTTREEYSTGRLCLNVSDPSPFSTSNRISCSKTTEEARRDRSANKSDTLTSLCYILDHATLHEIPLFLN